MELINENIGVTQRLEVIYLHIWLPTCWHQELIVVVMGGGCDDDDWSDSLPHSQTIELKACECYCMVLSIIIEENSNKEWMSSRQSRIVGKG